MNENYIKRIHHDSRYLIHQLIFIATDIKKNAPNRDINLLSEHLITSINQLEALYDTLGIITQSTGSTNEKGHSHININTLCEYAAFTILEKAGKNVGFTRRYGIKCGIICPANEIAATIVSLAERLINLNNKRIVDIIFESYQNNKIIILNILTTIPCETPIQLLNDYTDEQLIISDSGGNIKSFQRSARSGSLVIGYELSFNTKN